LSQQKWPFVVAGDAPVSKDLLLSLYKNADSVALRLLLIHALDDVSYIPV
jgi:hypothetical protein